MKKHSRIIFVMAACLVGFIGQLAAVRRQSTNSVWGVTAVSALSGKIKDADDTNAATAVRF